MLVFQPDGLSPTRKTKQNQLQDTGNKKNSAYGVSNHRWVSSFSLSKTHTFPVAKCTCVLCDLKGRENRKKKKKGPGCCLINVCFFFFLISCCHTPLLPSEMALGYGLALIKMVPLAYPNPHTAGFKDLGEREKKKKKQKDGLHRPSQTGLARLVLYLTTTTNLFCTEYTRLD